MYVSGKGGGGWVSVIRVVTMVRIFHCWNDNGGDLVETNEAYMSHVEAKGGSDGYGD